MLTFYPRVSVRFFVRDQSFFYTLRRGKGRRMGGRRSGGLVVSNRMYRGDYRKSTAN